LAQVLALRIGSMPEYETHGGNSERPAEKMTMTFENAKVGADIVSPHVVDKTVRRLDDFPALVQACAMATGWLPVCVSRSCLMAIATRDLGRRTETRNELDPGTCSCRQVAA
jgi:hypothetical protein